MCDRNALLDEILICLYFIFSYLFPDPSHILNRFDCRKKVSLKWTIFISLFSHKMFYDICCEIAAVYSKN